MIRLLLVVGLWLATTAISYAEPAVSLPFKRALIREARWEYGLDAPIAVLAAQVGQESAWRPGVCSAYACGLTQFTASTASWIKKAYPDRLARGGVFNPDWALRALVIYDHHLYKAVPPAADDCARWAFTLASYNGGLGWINRDVRLCGTIKGCDPKQWWGNVALRSKRAAWALKENRGYPFKILGNQSTYAAWGKAVTCSRFPPSPLGLMP